MDRPLARSPGNICDFGRERRLVYFNGSERGTHTHTHTYVHTYYRYTEASKSLRDRVRRRRYKERSRQRGKEARGLTEERDKRLLAYRQNLSYARSLFRRAETQGRDDEEKEEEEERGEETRRHNLFADPCSTVSVCDTDDQKNYFSSSSFSEPVPDNTMDIAFVVATA